MEDLEVRAKGVNQGQNPIPEVAVLCFPRGASPPVPFPFVCSAQESIHHIFRVGDEQELGIVGYGLEGMECPSEFPLDSVVCLRFGLWYT